MRFGFDVPLLPLLFKNVPAASAREAREHVAMIVAIGPGALGIAPSSRGYYGLASPSP